jgi:hypothetical protein
MATKLDGAAERKSPRLSSRAFVFQRPSRFSTFSSKDVPIIGSPPNGEHQYCAGLEVQLGCSLIGCQVRREYHVRLY